MAAAPDSNIPHRETGQATDPGFAKNMATPETPRISLVTTAQKTPAWTRNLFHA